MALKGSKPFRKQEINTFGVALVIPPETINIKPENKPPRTTLHVATIVTRTEYGWPPCRLHPLSHLVKWLDGTNKFHQHGNHLSTSGSSSPLAMDITTPRQLSKFAKYLKNIFRSGVSRKKHRRTVHHSSSAKNVSQDPKIWLMDSFFFFLFFWGGKGCEGGGGNLLTIILSIPFQPSVSFVQEVFDLLLAQHAELAVLSHDSHLPDREKWKMEKKKRGKTACIRYKKNETKKIAEEIFNHVAGCDGWGT